MRKLIANGIWLTVAVSTSMAVADVGSEARVADPALRHQGPTVLTPRGSLVFEPGLQFTHSSGTDVAIEGYTVVPAVLVGLINVSESQRDTLTASATLRYGLFHRLEVEARVPYVYKKEAVRERDIFDGSSNDIVRDSSGQGVGDVEFALRYQLNSPQSGGAFYLANLRVKTRTGTDPFEVDRIRLYADTGDGDRVFVGEVYEEQPTGSGFRSFQPSLSFVYPTEPAVMFGSVSYLWNVERDVSGHGRIDPGDALGFNYGMGFGINAQTSFNLGYDHSIVFKTRRDDDAGLDAVFDRFHVGSLLFGLSHRLSPRTRLNVSLALGVTENAPDVQVGLRLPVTLW
ncbi:hypothetical protein CAI21_00160 [Alkalilimnicola ehrlichii]|uniref:Transporter n=1 Tax=Alkalilimnicola ehrlichii TaxID=351052 RepID=A0A3E0X1Q9_9GAMM|nr:hypothetical protein [Alkalilimnicola ehrlichii]RFA31116.1 hypothetical protein CAI21_00160 [Alkalilimnicola ehrlichii]RFA39599.1 hypothetical protein CAL65_02245 [Alkalilimnicola ehrlichii]